MRAEQTWGSDSPHVENALKVLGQSRSDPAVMYAVLAVADEIAEQRRQQHSDAIDLANAVATMTGVLEPREPLYAEYRPSWRDRMRVLFRGRL